MSLLTQKFRNLVQYFGFAPDKYYHAEAPANYDPDDPLAYYLDHSSRADYAGLRDGEGIPMYTHKGETAHLPVLCALYALAHCERYRRTTLAEHKAEVLKTADWFVREQDPKGVWLTPFAHAKFKVDKGFPSAMAQGMAFSVLVRAHLLQNNPDYLRAARKGLELCHVDVCQGGVRWHHQGQTFLEEYPSKQPHHVLNGSIYAMWGVYDLVRFDASEGAKTLWNATLSTLTDWLPRFDTGRWSLYHIGDGLANPATIPYHRLHIEQLRAMYAITRLTVFEEYAGRWEGYLNSRFNALSTLPRKILWNVVRGW